MSEPAPDHAALIARLRDMAIVKRRQSVTYSPGVFRSDLEQDAAALEAAADALAALRGATPAHAYGCFALDNPPGECSCGAAPPEATE